MTIEINSLLGYLYNMGKLNIFNYIDYRLFLKDYISYKKKINSGYSQRVLLRQMGITSSGFITNVIKGRNNLTIEQIEKLSSIMQLTPREDRYLKNLVSFAKAKSASEKNDFYQLLLDDRKKKLKYMDKTQDSLFRKWYFVVIKVLIDFVEITEDYKNLAKMVVPAITEDEAKEAVDTLFNLDFIERDDKGILRSKETAITTGDHVSSMFLGVHQQKMIDLGKDAIANIPDEERDVSGLTLSLNDETTELIFKEIRMFRKRLLKIADDTKDPDRVMRCNFQVFPVAKADEK